MLTVSRYQPNFEHELTFSRPQNQGIDMSVKKFGIAGLAAAGLAAQALLAAGSASAAVNPLSSGGGCSGSVAAGNGWSFNACISASGGYLHPDGYVTASGTKPANCEIEVDLIKNGKIVASGLNSCTSTHVYGDWGISGSGTYFTGIFVIINGTTTYTSEVTSLNEIN
jgi:hypothetical protein